MSSTDPLVFIVVLTWNQKELTDECLRSLSNVSYRNRRTVVVDNGSSDGSVEFLRQRHPEATFLSTGTNLGFSGGNNVGIDYALRNGAAYVFLLNNDTEVDPGFLSAAVDVAEHSRDIGIAGSTAFYANPADIVWFAGARANWLNGDMNDPRIGKRLPDIEKLPVEDVDEVAGAAMLVRREVIEQVGMLDPSFFIYYEETDWCQRAKRGGWRVVWVPASRIWHKVSMTFGEQSPAMVYLMTRNRWLFMRKNAPHFVLFACHYLARFSKRAFDFQRNGQRQLRNATLMGMRDALLGRYGRGALDRLRIANA